MALLNRFFPSRKKAQRSQRGYVPFSAKNLKWEPFDFAEDQVRVLLFRECERRGRKLLFDSKSLKKVPLQSNQPCTRTKSGSIPKANEKKSFDPPIVEVINGFGYQYFPKSGPDSKLLGEMIFGSVAMTVKGSTLKIHVGASSAEDKMNSSPTLMLTKVALSPLRGKQHHLSESFAEDSCGSSINSMSELVSSGGSSSDSKLYNNNFSRPVDVPHLSRTQFFLGTDTDLISRKFYDSVRVEDSGCYGDTSCQNRNYLGNSQFPVSITVDNERKVSGGSLSSVRRRWLRSTGSCLECQSSQNQLDSLTSCGSLNGSMQEGSAKRSKLGTAIVFNLTTNQSRSQLEFVLEHAALLESILLRLHTSMELAYIQKDLFVSMMTKATADVQQSFCDLMCGARLTAPVWLSLMSVSSLDHSSLLSARSSIATSFMYDLCHLLDVYDVKDTNFFISTLITAVLTHHLGWVSTVMCNNSHSSSKTGHALSEISKCHPYNPLWAQMMDLCGAVGTPLKTARTIVVSESPKARTETVERLLRVLSFFIRCAGIESSESSPENDCPLLEKSQGSEVTLVPSESSSRDPSMVSFCEVQISDETKNDENLMHRVDSTKIIINEVTRNISKESPIRSAKEKVNGMRRTMSYSAKMSREDEPEKALEAVDVPILKVSKMQLGPVEPEETSEVIFVLGENEDLVGLKGKRDEKCDKRAAQQSEQALSEVESGFSECDSLELSPLSPVRTTRQTKGKCQLKCWCGSSRFNAGELTRTCLLDVTNDLSVFKKSESVHSSMMQLEQETKRKNRFLARSLSVNLPVCQRLVKQVPQMCNKCGGASGAENVVSRTCSKKDVCRRLHKASSLLSFNSKSVSAKGIRENLSPCRKSRSSDEVCSEEREQVRWSAGDADRTDVRRIPLTRLPDEELRVPQWKAGIAGTLFGGVSDHYVSDRALQGIVTPPSGWPLVVKRDLSIDAANPILDPEITEAVAIIGRLDMCQVDLLSSNAPHRGELSPQGTRVTISRLVANMLESLRHLWLIGASPELCVNVLEERLAQLCTRSYALVDLLLSTELCDIDTVTSALSIDANDVPLLLAVASTYSPEVTRRYGISFR